MKVYAAIDRSDLAGAAALAAICAGRCGIKLGLEFFCANGPAGVRAAAAGAPLFLDLKPHDIPNTVAGALNAVLPLAPRFVTVHAAGGPAMLRAAAATVRQAADRPRLLAVTVLTSLDAADLAAAGQDADVAAQTLRLARLAVDCGVDGLVCSPLEIAPLRAAFGPDLVLMVPGIRPAGAADGDQKRTMTPRAALAAGATHLVIGRPIAAAPDPAAALAAILAETG